MLLLECFSTSRFPLDAKTLFLLNLIKGNISVLRTTASLHKFELVFVGMMFVDRDAKAVVRRMASFISESVRPVDKFFTA